MLWLAMAASLLWMRAMISVREWALPMPRWRSGQSRRAGALSPTVSDFEPKGPTCGGRGSQPKWNHSCVQDMS